MEQEGKMLLTKALWAIDNDPTTLLQHALGRGTLLSMMDKR